MTLYERFLRQAKEQIALRHLTLTEVGETIGLSTAQVSRVLNGVFRIKGDNLLRMAMILEISLDEIIFPETDLVVDSMTMAQGSPVPACQKRRSCKGSGTRRRGDEVNTMSKSDLHLTPAEIAVELRKYDTCLGIPEDPNIVELGFFSAPGP